MAEYTANRIEKPHHFRLGHLRQGRGKRKLFIIGFDSEAENGHPFMMQFAFPEQPVENTLLVPISRKKDAGLHAFMRVIHEYCIRRDTEYIVYGHNLQYEFTQLFHNFDTSLMIGADDFTFYVNEDGTRYDWQVMTNKRNYAIIRNRNAHVTIRLLDTMAFYPTSLDKAARMLGLGQKYEKPERFARADQRKATFRSYARQDAYLARLLGEKIAQLHTEYDVPTCISAPHFASRVFRHRFLHKAITLATEPQEQYGLWSYHGGKNGYYLPGPTQLPDVYALDIRSAYPEAMRQLPDPTEAEWEHVEAYEPGQHGIYHVSGSYPSCRYRGIQTVGGQWLASTRFLNNAFITSYELDELVRRGEFVIEDCDGWIMRGPGGGPLAEYVGTFYHMKSTTTDATERVTAKLFLNSLYGKFFQKVPLGIVGYYSLETGQMLLTNPEEMYDWQAGGLYHPPIASLITGYVRAKIHRLEHEHDAIMTSTDGIFAMRAPSADQLGSQLGMLDAERGALRIWRERLYIFDGVDGVRKIALHGFMGSADELAMIPLTRGVYDYRARKVVTLKESARKLDGRRYPPGAFVDLARQLDLSHSKSLTA